MLRCAGVLSSTAAHTSAVRLCAAGAMRHGAAAALHPRPLSAVATTRRTFFPPGTPGSDLLRHLTTPAEPTKAFSPLDKLRPPAPPTASDAQPFGSLNRTNQLRRYVNVNTTSSSESNAATAAGSGSSSASNAASVSTGAAASPMDLSRLVRRHTSSNMKSTHTLSDASSATQPHVTAATHGASSPLPSTSQPAASTHAAVARAQAAIAAAQQHSDALQAEKMAAEQQQHTIASSSNSTQANASTTASTSRGHAGDRGASPARQHSQVYKEHCYIGWSPEEFYRVVADVEHYADFLPWCAGSEVHTTRRVQVPRGRRLLAGNAAATASTAAAGAVGEATADMALEDATAAATANAVAAELVDAIEMTATLTIGFSFLKEQYTSRVTLYPGTKIVAALYDEDEVEPGGAGSHAVRAPPPRSHAQDSFVVSLFKKAASTAGAAAKRSILKHLLCEWEFCPVPGKPNTVEVVFSVSFEFKNPLHSHMIMSNVVTLMTRSFERRCESLYGPPSATKESLPLFF